MDGFQILKTVAPWIASAITGPLGGMAIEAASNAFGLSEKTEGALKAAISSATPEQMMAVKKADQEFSLQMQELGFKQISDLAALEVRDRESARQRESNVKDSTNKILAYAVVGGFLAVVGGTLAGWAKVDSVLAGSLIGYLSAKAEQVLAYYFGSTAGSAEKSKLLAQAQPPK